MGRWDDYDGGASGGNFMPDEGAGKRRNWPRIFKFAILAGFVILGAVLLSVFIPRAGLNVEIFQRGEAVGTVTTVSVKVTNNSLETMRNVTIQFGDRGAVQEIGDMPPFKGVLVSPHQDDDVAFDKVTVTANDGAVVVVKHRSLQQIPSH